MVPFGFLAFLVSVPMTSCTTLPVNYVEAAELGLPDEMQMGRYAGLGTPLLVTVHLPSGVEFKCIIDTGSPWSLLPKSVESQLGKRTTTVKVSTSLDSPVEKVNLYKSPEVFLGNTKLEMGDRIGVWGGSMGVLGMDCLRHYCIQLEFAERKIRFLDPHRAKTAELGESLPLLKSPYTCIRQPGLFGIKEVDLLVDTGDSVDARVNGEVFNRLECGKNTKLVPFKIIGEVAKGMPAPKLIMVPDCLWHGENYTNLIIETGRPTLIGLRFLGRHTVTFDFPNRTMYLKRSRTDAAAQQSVER